MIFTFFRRIIVAFAFVNLLCGIVHPADRLTGQDIHNILVDRAKRDGVNISPLIAPQKVFTACDTDLEITPLFGNWKTSQISCSAPDSWKLNIRSIIPKEAIKTKPVKKIKKKIDPKPTISPTFISVEPTKKTQAVKKEYKKRLVKTFDYVVLTAPVQKGTILSDPKYFDLKSFQYKVRGGFTKLDQIIGRKLKASMPEGKPLLARHLATVYIVEKNDILKISIKRSGLEIWSEGIALSNGQLGEVIIVSNIDTGVKLKAKIKNSHEAEIISKQLN